MLLLYLFTSRETIIRAHSCALLPPENICIAAYIVLIREQPCCFFTFAFEVVHFSTVQAALLIVQPSAKREGFATIPDVTWEDVGALKDVREELTMAILVIK